MSTLEEQNYRSVAGQATGTPEVRAENGRAGQRIAAEAKQRGFAWRAKGYLCVASAALCWGGSASLGRAVFTGRLKIAGEAVKFISPLMLVQSRVTISFLILLLALPSLRGWKRVALRPLDILRCVLLGACGIAASNFFYYFAISKTNVATSIILQYTAPVLVLLYMLARRRQRATATRICGVVLAVTGCMLALGILAATAGFPWLSVGTSRLKFHGIGVLSAIAAAFAFAFWNTYGSSLVERYDRWRVILWGMFGAAAVWMLLNPPTKIVAAHYDARQWFFMLIFAIVSSLVPFSMYLWGLQHLDPTRAIVTSCLEPVCAVVVAALSLGETVTSVQGLGIAVVLTATVLVQIPGRAEKSPPALSGSD